MHRFTFKSEGDVALGTICELDGKPLHAKSFIVQVNTGEPPLLIVTLYAHVDIDGKVHTEYLEDT